MELGNAVFVTFNQELAISRTSGCQLFARLINLNTGEDVPGFTLFICGTTYEGIVGGKGRSAVKSLDREPISEVPEGVTLDGGVASWTFTTVPC